MMIPKWVTIYRFSTGSWRVRIHWLFHKPARYSDVPIRNWRWAFRRRA